MRNRSMGFSFAACVSNADLTNFPREIHDAFVGPLMSDMDLLEAAAA